MADILQIYSDHDPFIKWTDGTLKFKISPSSELKGCCDHCTKDMVALSCPTPNKPLHVVEE